MQGFDQRFSDFPDYILGITHEIWEERGIDTLNHYYAPDIVVRSPASISVGNAAVIKATRNTLHEFPDRELLGEDVIWCGNPETGLLSSHRILSTATHVNDGIYGRATGRKLIYRVIADCHAKNNVIDDEWLIRDQAAIVRQLGMHPREFVQNQLDTQGTAAPVPFSPIDDVPGPYKERGNNNVWGELLATTLNRLHERDDSVITDTYDRAAQLEYPGYVRAHGYSGSGTFWTSFFSAFPGAQFTIDHQIGRADDNMPARAAVRWSLHGSHEGSGYFGAPTGAEVYVMGITHAEFGSLGMAPVKLRREYTLFDETAVWMQILKQT